MPPAATTAATRASLPAGGVRVAARAGAAAGPAGARARQRLLHREAVPRQRVPCRAGRAAGAWARLAVGGTCCPISTRQVAPAADDRAGTAHVGDHAGLLAQVQGEPQHAGSAPARPRRSHPVVARFWRRARLFRWGRNASAFGDSLSAARKQITECDAMIVGRGCWQVPHLLYLLAVPSLLAYCIKAPRRRLAPFSPSCEEEEGQGPGW